MFLCINFFFFFKQKTAYEMRISDWSSDVCSSDLCRVRAGEKLAAQLHSALDLTGQSVCLERIAQRHGSSEIASHRLQAIDRADIGQIGSASGRERVCQYV